MISLLAGNSRILLTVGERGCWEQLYYPYPGLHQQLRQVRLGLYDRDQGTLEWIDQEGEPPVSVDYLDDTNVCRTRWERGGIEIEVQDMVHPDRDMIVRRIRLRNPALEPRRLSVFHYQSMQLAGSAYRETAYWDERRKGLHHYKRSYHMQFVGRPVFDGFSCGEHTLKGLEGSHADAEDGRLMGNVVSHGSSDSIGQWDVDLAPGKEHVLHLFVLIGRSRQDIHDAYQAIDGRDPEMYIRETVGYWNRWIEDKQGRPSFDLSPAALSVYRRSLFVLRNCTGENGAPIASPDAFSLGEGGDGYEYCWWRDGAYISIAMSQVGMHQAARAFLRFAARCQEEDGSFLHRHFPDGKLGPTWHPPDHIQVDQTASVVQAVYRLYRDTGDVEELLTHWELVRKAADFLIGFVGDDRLPLPSYDLWEERLSTSTYSTGMVVQALDAAAAIAKALGRRYDFWAQTATDMRDAAVGLLWNEERGAFLRARNPTDDAIDASTLMADLLPPGDERHARLLQTVEEHLWQEGVGGIARYKGDHYFGDENPWIICTLWLARAHLRLGDRDRCRQLIEWAAQRAVRRDLLPEQVDAETGGRRGVIPLIWSHSTFIELVNEYSAVGRSPAIMAVRQEVTA